jgi:hypothetical protein
MYRVHPGCCQTNPTSNPSTKAHGRQSWGSSALGSTPGQCKKQWSSSSEHRTSGLAAKGLSCTGLCCELAGQGVCCLGSRWSGTKHKSRRGTPHTATRPQVGTHISPLHVRCQGLDLSGEPGSFVGGLITAKHRSLADLLTHEEKRRRRRKNRCPLVSTQASLQHTVREY